MGKVLREGPFHAEATNWDGDNPHTTWALCFTGPTSFEAFTVEEKRIPALRRLIAKVEAASRTRARTGRGA